MNFTLLGLAGFFALFSVLFTRRHPLWGCFAASGAVLAALVL
ncbi:MAG: hypothetical protein R3E95_06780 [Thiolinea sp.]